jgi:hypothetical protein
MAQTKAKAATKEPEKGRQPDFVVRARQEPGSEFFVNCGAAWKIEVNGKEAISLKIQSMPVNSDGSFLLLPPLEAKE